MTEGGSAPAYLDALSAFARAAAAPGPDFCLIDAMALGVWGAVRATQDIDFLILLDEDRRAALFASLAAAGFLVDTRWADLNLMARQGFVPLAFGQHAIDLMLARDEDHREALRRKRRVAIEGRSIDVASAEDLMLLKLRAGRDQDFVDVAAVAARQGPALDLPYLRGWAGRLGIARELEYALGAAGS